MFKFIVGEEGTEVLVHSGPLSAASRNFGALMSGGMSESRDGCATLKDVDLDTFLYFVEYAYHGEYRLALPKIFYQAYNSYYGQSCGKMNDSYSIFSILTEAGFTVSRKIYPSYIPTAEGLTVANYASKWFEDKDFTLVFLAQGRLYVLAQFRDIPPLKHMVIQQLYHEFRFLPPCEERIEGFMKLVKFAYTHEDIPSMMDGDALKNLLINETVRIQDSTGTSETYRELLEENDQFVADLNSRLPG